MLEKTERTQVVSAAIIRGDRILLIQRTPKPGWPMLDFVFATPGGKLDPGENDAEALCREISEELGLTITGTIETIAYSIQLDYPEVSRAVDLRCYVVPWNAIDGQPRALDGVEGFAWFDATTLRMLALAPADAVRVESLVGLLAR
jgi:8-oxo-dGTP diphosphatase